MFNFCRFEGTVDENIPTKYKQAIDIKSLWEKLRKPRIAGYSIGKKYVYYERTPKGEGYGIWERNPDFDYENHWDEITALNCCGGLQIIEIKVE